MSTPAPHPFPHVALFPATVDASLTNKGVPRPEEGLLPTLRSALRAGGCEQLVSLLDDYKRPKAQRVFRGRWNLFSPEAADGLPPEQRLACIPIAGSRDVTLRKKEEALEVAEVRAVSGGESIVVRRHHQTGRPNSLVALHGETRCEFYPPLALVERLFGCADPPKDVEWALGPQLRAPSKRPEDTFMPAQLTEAFADVLQDHLRVHTLLHSALPPSVSRPLAFEACKLYKDLKRAIFSTNVHRSCLPASGCLCPQLSRGAPCRAGGFGVQVMMLFCGGDVEAGRCMVHHQCEFLTDDVVKGCCTRDVRLALRCGHAEGSQLRQLNTPESALPALRTIAATAVELARSPPDAEAEADANAHAQALLDRVQCSVEEAELVRIGKKPKASLGADRRATEMMRTGKALQVPYSVIYKLPKKGKRA